MKTKIAIYLAGTIKKGHESANETYWTDEHMQLLRREMPNFEISFLNPALRSDDMSDQLSVFGRDMVQVSSADVIFVDARDRRGLGVGAEMMWAKVNGIPLITWAPQDTHYHHTSAYVLDVLVKDWVHPFVENLSDKLVEDLVEAAAWMRKSLFPRSVCIKGRECILSAMQHYQETQFSKDVPMQELFEAHPELHGRAEKRVGGFAVCC